MSSELELSKQRITELEAEISGLRIKLSISDAELAELKRMHAEVLRANGEHNERRDAENAKLRARIEKMESEFGDRITKVKQMQSQNEPRGASHNSSNDNTPNDNNPNNNSSNFALAPSANSGAVHHEKSSQEKEMDNFLDEVDKKSVGEDIRRRNKEKKIQRESANQDITPEPAYVAETNNDDNLDEPSDRRISEKSGLFGNFVNKIHNFHDRNIDKSKKDNWLDCDLSSRKDLPEDDDFTVPSEQVVERDLMQQLSVPSTSIIDTEISLTPPVIDKKQQFSVTAECIVYMFRKAVRSGYEEILHWYGFAESYDKRINEIRTINKVKINTAKQQVYQEVKKLLPDISDVNLRQQLSRARKLYKLFNAVGVEKIKQVTYSANAISNLNNTQIQNIIDYVISKAVTGDHQTPKNNQIIALEAQERSLDGPFRTDSAEVSKSSPPIPQPESPVHNRSYFRNKILDQYPNFIKCEQREIEITA